MKNIIPTILLSALIGAAIGSLTSAILLDKNPTQETLARDFYLTEEAVHTSPHSLRKRIDQGDKSYILVDVRSPQEYAKEHIVTAINIPAYIDPNTSISLNTDKEEKERIIKQFRELPKDKEIIIYCYSIPCMTGRKIGKLLSENGIYTKQLGIGWNEWRYFWTLWNHDGETPTKVEDYIISGKDPGLPKVKQLPSPCGEGELSC